MRVANGRKPVTLADIGRQAGVSISIVSRVLSDSKDRIPERTRQKVIEAADELGYRPNLLIRGVQTGRSMNIGVIVPSTGSFYSKIVHGIHDEFQKNNYCVLLAWNAEGVDMPGSHLERDLIHSLVDRRVDGIILLPNHPDVSDVYFAEVQERDIPMVTVDRPLPGVHCDFAGTDDELGARLAARHLIEAGHHRLVHLAAEEDPFAPGHLRQKGFEEECAAVAGVTGTTLRLPRGGGDTLEVTIEEMLSSDNRPTAVSLAIDSWAVHVYRVAKKLKLRIPEDLSVIGFGNLERDDFADPPLTSIDQHPYEVGQNAARLILTRIGGETGDVRQALSQPTLVERESVARPGE